ncbi:glycosyltransferase [Pectobacterium colocasium]|uniref:glycosyltransferase n=1 Tax=Pectobacterium colocasium TaxID=2878098 RepID=UPI003B289009
MEKFSVLMSLYEKESSLFFEQCLSSLYSQTLPASEIILVLDGKVPVSLLSVIERWENKLPLKVIPLSSNVGLGNALNEGLKYCNSDIIVRMDTDDICCSDRFLKQVEFMTLNPDVVLVGGQIQEFNNEVGDAKNVRSVPCTHAEIFKFSKMKNPFNHMSVSFRKKIILSLGGYTDHFFMEDYNLWLRVLGKGYKTINLKDILVYARVGNGMVSRRRGVKYIVSEFKLAKLKCELKFQKIHEASIVFLLRSLPRLLPSMLLSLIYNYVRKNKGEL